LRRGIHYTLLLVHLYESGVVYLDSGSANHKDYTDIKGVLDKAFNGFALRLTAPSKSRKKYEDASPSSTKPSSAATSRLSQIVGWRPGMPSYI
jgi:hypothetical protein